jgi:hypothetical protein
VYDRGRTGEVPADILAIALRRAGFYPSATTEEIELVQRLFPGQSHATIKWEPFAAAVDPVLENTSISQSPSSVPPTPTRQVIPPGIPALLTVIRDACKRENVNLGDELRRRDHNHTGVLLTSAFVPAMRVILPHVPLAKLMTLTEFYGELEFRYVEFLRDLENIPSTAGGADASGALIALLRRIKAHLTQSLTDPAQLFRAADPSRAGYCRKDRTPGCFNLSRMTISDGELALLFNAYPVDGYPERFNYRELCRVLGTMRMDRVTAAWEIDPRGEAEKHAAHCHAALHAIRERLNARRTTIWPYFEDCKRERISEKEFWEKIRMMNLQIPYWHFDVFFREYGDSEGINWKNFCADLERTVFV